MNVFVSCDYQDGSAAGAGKSLAMCFGAIVALSKVLKSVSGVTSLSFRGTFASFSESCDRCNTKIIT